MKKIINITAVLICMAVLSSCAADMNFGQRINGLLDEFTGSQSEPVEMGEEQQEFTEVSNTVSLGVTDFDTWNPILTKSSTVKEVLELIYEPMFEIDTNHCAVPVLASGYWVSDDGKTVEVTLNNEIKWQDGDLLDAYDAAYTVKQILNSDGQYKDLLADVADYRAISASVIRFVLKRSVPNFTALLTFPIIKYQSAASIESKPMGTGPYSFSGKIGTDKYMLIANDIYHKGRGEIDGFYITVAPDVEKYRLMFEASEFDLMTDSTIEPIDGMPNGNITVHDYITDKLCYIGLNTQSSVLENEHTRVGLSYLIDRDTITTNLLYSRAVPVKVAINPSSYLYYDISKKFGIEYETAYDEFEKAGWESKEKGFKGKSKNGALTLKINLLVNSDNKTHMTVANKIAADMERYGVEVNLDKQPYEMYLARISAHNYDAFIGEIELEANGDFTPLTGADNCFSYYNPDVNTLISQCGMTQDEGQMKSLFISLGQMLDEDMPYIPLYFSKGCVIAGTKIKTGIEPSVSADYRNSHIWSVK